MMKKLTIILFLTAIFLILPGCWSKNELTQRGFVMGVALDQGKNGKIDLLTQIYRPIAGEGATGASGEATSINIKTSNDSVIEAVRDIPIHLGRKAQWSHMRVIIIGEKLARTVSIGKVLDFFYRDHEPRLSVTLMVSKGSASSMLEKKPFIEQTTAQQLLSTEESSYSKAAKTLDTSLLDLVMQMKSAHNDAVVSYVYEDKQKKDVFSSAGLALFKDGKMKGILPSSKVEGLVMLRNEYKSGIIEVPCAGMKNVTEAIEILSLQTRMKPKLAGDKISVSIKIKGDASIGELKCTTIDKAEDEAAFIRKIEEKMKNQILATIRYLQKNKMEVIGVGNDIYRVNPKKWRELKKTWDNQFAEISFDVQVELRLITNGVTSGKPTL